MRNPFKPLDAVEAERIRKEKESLESLFKLTREVARRLLASEDGKAFKKRINEAERALIKYCETNVHADPVKDGYMLRCAMNKLEVYRALLEGLENEAE